MERYYQLNDCIYYVSWQTLSTMPNFCGGGIVSHVHIATLATARPGAVVVESKEALGVKMLSDILDSFSIPRPILLFTDKEGGQVDKLLAMLPDTITRKFRSQLSKDVTTVYTKTTLLEGIANWNSGNDVKLMAYVAGKVKARSPAIRKAIAW